MKVFYLIFHIYICPLYRKTGLIKRNKTVEEVTSGLINTMRQYHPKLGRDLIMWQNTKKKEQ